MRYSQLVENLQDPILDLIQAARHHFGEDELFYGNCGEFAWALGKHVQQTMHKQAMLVFLTNKYDDNDHQIDDPGAADLYHVMLELDGTRYDGQGVCSDSYIIQFAQRAYYKTVDEIELWTSYPLDAESQHIIHDGTDPTIMSDRFLKFFNSLN